MNLLKTKNGKKVGKALSIICGLFIVINVFYMIGYIFNLFNLELANKTYIEQGLNIVLTYPIIIYQIIMSALIVVSSVLILKGEKIGIYIYFGIQILGTIYSLIANTFKVESLMPLLGMFLVLGWLIYRKKDVFFEPKVIV